MPMPANKEVVIDLLGAMFCQGHADRLTAEALIATQDGLITVTFKNIGGGRFPRLIVDYGDIVGLLVDELRKRDEASKVA